MPVDSRHSMQSPVDAGGWGWIVVFGTFMIHFIADGIAYSFGIYVESFLVELNATESEVGLLGSLNLGITLGAGVVPGVLVNKWGCRIVTMVGAAVASIGFFITYFADNIRTMYVSYGIIAGIGFAMVYTPGILAVAFYFDKKRTLATSLALTGSGCGTLVFAPITHVMIEEYGWRGTVLIEGALVLNCVVCGALFRPLILPVSTTALQSQFAETSQQPLQTVSRIVADQDLQPARPAAGGAWSRFKTLKTRFQRFCTNSLDLRLLLDWKYVVFAIANVFGAVGYNVPYVYLPKRATVLGIDNSRAAFLISIMGIALIVSRLLTSLAGDRPCVNRLMVFATTMLLSGVACIASAIDNSYWFLASFSAFYGFVTSVYVCLTSVVLADMVGVKRLSNAFGMILLFVGIGTIGGPPMAGYVYEITQDYNYAFHFCGVSSVVGGLLVFLIPLLEWHKRQNIASTSSTKSQRPIVEDSDL